ncbi:hypothetical protein Gohar_013234 [Gossypium harknessii]|uniref:Aminotransferase-like plant mobile domain-containing protein n=1 Tax=Gossypium harknessii TaxID=34285 RepID=A0A7J9GZP8_9ROSI|nr:hypothetical protein [Gossypium harknessii]
MLWSKDGNRRHTFHLLYDECIITLEDVSLQLRLLVDGEVIMGIVISVNCSATCEQLLENVSNKFRGSRKEIRWLEDNFQTIEISASGVEKEQFAHTLILRLIEGLLMIDKSHNLVHLRRLLLVVDLKEVERLRWGSAVLATLYREMWNNPVRHNGISTELEDIRLVLDQQTENEFVLLPYVDPSIQEYVPIEFLANQKIWHVKVPLVIFVTIVMYESDQLDDLHKIDLRGKLKEDWPTFHKKYIDMWQLQKGHNDKSYLLAGLKRSRQRRHKRPRQWPINPRSGEDVVVRLRFTPSAPEDSISSNVNLANTTNIVVLPRWVIFATIDSNMGMYDVQLGHSRSQ